jgi:type 1 fimbria pilin
MRNRIVAVLFVQSLFLVATLLASPDKGAVVVKGYVLDSACAFTKDLKKPISKACAESCAVAGSPLVILAPDGVIYWPISDATPAIGQNSKLRPYAGQQVTVTGKVYERGGSRAIVIEKIQPQSESK